VRNYNAASVALCVTTVLLILVGFGMFVYPLWALWYQHPELHP
jgi:hypothetical protein